ncbi:hypothetical protein TURU_089041 [Turdus rufiventris]|nr:hypothetical protein TURU_089041 [Turdus rufiventris]
MAGYLSPGAYFYAEEQEYLQAYEDVLERYKGACLVDYGQILSAFDSDIFDLGLNGIQPSNMLFKVDVCSTKKPLQERCGVTEFVADKMKGNAYFAKVESFFYTATAFCGLGRISVYIASVKIFGLGGNSENFGDMNPKDSRPEGNGDERDKVQKKTFTKWINQHLMKVRKHVNDLYEDLRDGHNLISLLEVLSGDTLPRERDFLKTLRLVSSTEACANEQHEDVEDEDKGPREKGRMRFHRLQNVQIALDYLKKRQVKLVNIRNDDITDGNPKLTLGLIWTIILHFQILFDIFVTVSVPLNLQEFGHNRVYDFRVIFCLEQDSQMGNVCGCVRAEKEEQCLDPAKAPLSPDKHSPGRKYFRRKRRKKSTEEGSDSAHVKENEGKRQYEVEISENIKIHPKGVGLADFFPRRVTVAGNALPVSTDLSVDTAKAKVFSEEAKSDSLCGESLHGDNQRLAKSAEPDTWLKEQDKSNSEKHCAWKCSQDDNRRELAFLKKSSGLGYRKGTTSDSAIHILGRQHEETELNITSCRVENVSESSKSEKLRRFLSERKSDPVLEQKRFYPDAVLSHLPKEKAFFSIAPNRSKISDIHVTGESEDMSAKERLLLWSQQTTEGYAGVRCENFTTCWRDGRPDLIDMNTVAVQSNLANLEHAFFVAEKLGVARLLDPEDVDVSSPDEKSVITYVSSLYDAFPKVPEGGEGISANDVEVKWVEYQNMVNYLMQWIRHHVTIMSDRTFPNNPVELKALYNQYLQFKETEIPPKEIEKSKIKHLYKLLEVWIEFGRIKLSQGYHPNDIEKEWGKLIIAMLEREKTLRPEVERLEMLQQIANRIQRDSRSCEDKLVLARNALQSDTKRLESGLQFQHEAEIAGYLLESENLLRQQVIDAQILIDGKYYQADQLVQRVAKLRDDLMAIRTECSSVYNKGHALSTEQTKLMISGITESLNSGFTTNLTPELNAAMTQGLTPTLTSSGLTSGLTSRLTPAITPAHPSGIPPRLIQSYVTGVDSGTLQTLKLMQIRKPLMKSAFVDQNLTEEEVNMKFVQDLLSWVEEMQVQLDRAEWGSDLPSVESHLENHKNVHKAIEEFESSLKEAKISEIQMTAPLKLTYAEKLHKLESQYSKLLNTSRNQERHLDTLHNFVSRATRELIWLNEKEEEEVAYDWSERNPNITRKKEYHAELMRELDEKEEVIKSVQEIAEQLLLENHPARLTIEFFSDAKEAMEYLKNLKDTIYRKYSCDRSSSLHRLEDLVQESMEEKEQLLQYKSTVAGLVGRAKAIIQLKPRNPDCVLKTSIPIKAICDYRQIEITIYKDDECVLANNSHRAKWKVISPSGNEAMVPSVCFTVPPPNKEAIDTANRIEQQFQNVLALWHESHVNMKSVVSWHYLTNEIEVVRAGNVASIKTMLPGEHQQVLSNLQSRFDDFVEDSQESKIFTSSDTAQLEREVNVCKQYYQELLKSAEREEQEESIYNLYISEVRNIRLRLESCEERLIRQIRTPMERDDVHENVLRISEQEKLKKELDRLKDDLGVITDKCEEFFSQAAGSPSVPTLRSELNVVIQNMNQVYSMSSIFIDKLKTINLVLTNTQTAESLVKHYETKLCEEEAVTADKNNIENLMGTLKQWRSEVDEKRQTFHALEDELQKAKMISDQMFKMHKERDLDFDWHKEKVDQLAERWQNVHSQIENRLRDLEGINKSLKYYKDTYNSLDTWIQQVEDTQRKIQEIHPENSKALAKQLNQHKMLVSEIEMKQSKIDECQKYSEQYSAAVKDYELQTMTYRAMVDSQQKSPVKRRRMQSSSDFIIQEFMDLRTRYTALVTLMTQYIKFAGDSLKRLEEEESLPEENQLQQPVKSAEVFQHLGCNEDLELREEKKPNESMMDVEYLQNQNSSSKPEYTENKLEMNRRKFTVDRYDKIKTGRTFKQLLNFSGQESSISGNKDSELHTEQESLMGFGNQSKEEKNCRIDCFVSTEICVTSNDPGEMLNEQIANGERQKTEGKLKKLPVVEEIHKITGKKGSRKAGNHISTKEESEVQSETDFELTTKKAEVTPKTAKQALGMSPYKQQHFSQRTNFQCHHEEDCFTESKSHNTLKSENREFQVCSEKGDSLSGAMDATSLDKVASSFRELAEHNESEKTKLNLQSVSNPGVSHHAERNTDKQQKASLDKDCFLIENEILEKSNLNSNKARNTEQEILAVSSGNISVIHCAAKVSESHPLDFQVSPVQNDQHLGTELLGNAGDLNANVGLSGFFSGGEDYFPLSEQHKLGKKLLSHSEKVSVKKIPQGNTYSLDNINRSGKKQSGEDRLEQGQKYEDLLLVSEGDSRDEGNSKKVPGKTTELQKTFGEKVDIKASFEKKEKQKKREKDNEEKRSTTIIKILKSREASARQAYSDLMARQNSTADENKKLMGKVKTLEEMLENMKKQKIQVELELPKVREAAEKERKKQQKEMEEICLQKTKAEQEAKQCRVDLESIEREKADAEQELECVRQFIVQAETQRSILEENLRAFRNQVEESTFARRNLEELLRRKDTNLHDLEKQKNTLMQELKKKTDGEEKLMKLIKQMEQDLDFKGNLSEIKMQERERTECRRKVIEGTYSVTRETSLPIFTAGQDQCRIDSEMTSFQKKLEAKKVEELKQKIDELTLANKKADKMIKDLKYELNEIELQKSSTEEKSRLLKEKLDKVNSELKCLKIKLEEKDQVEQGYLQQLKELDRQLQRTTGKAEEVMQENMDLKKLKMNYQEDLKSVQQEKTHLKREIEELTRSQTKTEITIKHLNSQISSLQKEKLAAEHRTQSCKGEANNLQDQYKKIKEQLLQKTKVEKENQHEIQMLKNELTKSNHVSETLKQQIEDLNKWNTETKLLMKQIQSQSEEMALEKQNIQRKNDALKALADGFKEQLRTTNEQLHKQTIIEQEYICKIKSLEVDLAKAKDLASDYKQKYDKQNASTLSIDREVKNLNAQMNALTVEKRMSEQKIALQQAHVQELSNKLKKLQDELHQKTVDEQMARKKMILFQEESIKFKHSAEEFRKKVEKLLESHSITEKDISGIKLECVALQQEKHRAEENIMLYKRQMEDLQERLKKCHEQLQQGKQAEMDYHQKCRKLEEELEAQKRMVESLKQKMDLQVRESEHRFLSFQNEVQQNNKLQDSGFKLSCERRGNDFSYLSETAAKECEQLPPRTKPSSPLLRQKQERSGFKSDQIEENTLYVSADDTVPREVQFQMSSINQSLEDSSSQSFTEFVSQMSTQFQITFDKTSQISGTSERDTLRNRNLHSSRQTIRHGEDAQHELGVVKRHPLEIVKNKHYDMHVEVTTLNQENDKTFGNEERMFQGYKTSEGFRKEDFAKMSSFLGEEVLRTVDDATQLEYFTKEYDAIKFQGLRHGVTARQLTEVKLLDRLTVEQLISGQKTIDEVQKGLEKFLSKPTAIAGLYLESSKEILSFALAAKRKIIGKAMSLAFLEAQAATGFIIDPTTGQKFSVDDSVVRGLADSEFKSRLLEAEKAVLGYCCLGKVLSVFQAMEAQLLERRKGKNILEAQIACGGVIDPVRSVRVPPEAAVQLGLLNNTILKFLHEPSSNAKCFHNPNNMKAMYYCDLLKMCLFSVSNKCFLLPVGERKISNPSAEKSHKISVINVDTGAEMTSYEAYKKNYIDKATYLELSKQEFDWKESTCFDSDGNSFLLLTDLKTGVQFNIEETLNQGRIDRALVNKYKEDLITVNEFGDILVSSSQPNKDLNSPIAGFWLSETNERIPVLKASRKNLVDRVTALRCLEAQVSTGGVIDPFTGKKYSVSEALQRELIDDGCAKQIQQCELIFTGIIHPVRNTVMSAVEAVHLSAIDKEMGMRCLEYQYLTGGLIDPKSHSRLTMEDAIKNGIIDAITATKMKDENLHIKVLTCPKTKKKITYKEALDRAVFDCHTGLRLLEAAQPMKTGISSLYYNS